jgi:aspartyl-tRNA(Asn)/glutamyl-tRNA(Gln) amidotransferase subunit C
MKGGSKMGVTVKDVEYVSELARLKFSEDKLNMFTHDLNDILGYVNKLSELDTDNVEISVNPVYIENAFREDELEESLDREEVLKNAPERQDGYFKVPKVIEG